MTPITTERRINVQKAGTYDIYIEIDIDCEELCDACDLGYERCEDDESQNEILISLNSDEFEDFQADAGCWYYTNEQDIGTILLNAELGEYVTKVTIYKPSGDIISFC